MLDQVALEAEARISPLINEKKRLFNDLLTAKGTHRLPFPTLTSIILSLRHAHMRIHILISCKSSLFPVLSVLI